MAVLSILRVMPDPGRQLLGMTIMLSFPYWSSATGLTEMLNCIPLAQDKFVGARRGMWVTPVDLNLPASLVETRDVSCLSAALDAATAMPAWPDQTKAQKV